MRRRERDYRDPPVTLCLLIAAIVLAIAALVPPWIEPVPQCLTRSAQEVCK